ncbi:hypothetical protein [Nonomuraea aurantiaca]|nr:hypothetical protein [Nonomuraea aurantiaca]MCA2229874.1 hypothetical protein [Nonomuraea aurantiaca]
MTLALCAEAAWGISVAAAKVTDTARTANLRVFGQVGLPVAIMLTSL